MLNKRHSLQTSPYTVVQKSRLTLIPDQKFTEVSISLVKLVLKADF